MAGLTGEYFLESARFGHFIFLFSMLPATSLVFCSGIAFAWSSPIESEFKNMKGIYRFSDEEFSWIGSSVLLGKTTCRKMS
jgi:hypothetical protein